MPDKLPIIGRGEVYVRPAIRPKGSGPKSRPHEYSEARLRILKDIDEVLEQMDKEPDLYLKEKVVCVRMEPKFEAKSYIPTSILRTTDEMSIIGGRRYTVQPDLPTTSSAEEQGEVRQESSVEETAKLYFFRTTTKGISDFAAVLSDGSNDGNGTWRNDITSMHSFDLLSPEEKVLGFEDEWISGSVEAVLHPLKGSEEAAIELFCNTAGLNASQVEIRTYPDGITFIAADMTKEATLRVAQINPLRTVHPLGKIAFEPIRGGGLSAPAPQLEQSSVAPEVTIGVFDGGCNPDVPLLVGYATAHDCVASEADSAGIDHGTAVCGAVLHGELSGMGADDVLPAPSVNVESFRVLPPSDVQDFDLYESIDAVERVVNTREEIRIFNLSFGPRGPILDDDISRFTYALDTLSFDDKKEPPLFCIAAGNDGDLPDQYNRVQSPSDLVNGLGVGAFCLDSFGAPRRARYSCLGPGREGAKVKPDLLEYGGDPNRPFVVVSSEGNALGASAGTSFASPLVAHKIGLMMAQSDDVSQHLARAILLHNTALETNFSQAEYGFGLCPEKASECLICDDNRVTTLYQGILKPKQIVSLPIFAPGIEEMPGMANISWTIIAVCDTDPNDSDAYTSSCIEDTFVPHAKKFKFERNGETITKNLATDKGKIEAAALEEQGYKKGLAPISKPGKKYWEESDLRANDLKWDTVIKRSQHMRCSSLYEPSLALRSIFRNNDDPDAFTRYYVVVTVEALRYKGSLYDATLQNYQNLQPIRLRLEQRLEARG